MSTKMSEQKQLKSNGVNGGLNGINHERDYSLPDSPIVQDEEQDMDNGHGDGHDMNGDLQSIPKWTVNQDRVKHRAKRMLNGVAQSNGVYLNANDDGQVLVVNGMSVVNGVVHRNVSSFKKLTKNSRRSRGRFGRGLSKKGGAGGKGTWGKPGSELVSVEEDAEDPYDPNYDSDSQDNCKFQAITPPLDEDEIERHVIPILTEYFEHGDTDEVAYSLEELNLGDNYQTIVVLAISLAMERKASQREMTSVLISDLYGRLLHEEEIEKGFYVLLNSLPDLILDTPQAPTVLGNFIARAVADDCIPPKFVQTHKGTLEDPNARIAMEHADVLLNMKHGLVRLDTVWGVSGGMRPVKYLVKKIQLLLREYLSSGDVEEATRCLRELEVPHFHHELVYEALVLVIEDMGERAMDLTCTLLKSLCSAVIVTLDQLKRGFKRVYEEMPEICIDVPHAYNILEKMVFKCSKVGFVPLDSFIVKDIPQRGRKRFVSEGDGGKEKLE